MDYILERNWLYFVLSAVWAYMIYAGSMEIAVRKYGQFSLAIMGAVCGTVLLYAACRYLNGIWGKNLKWVICQVGKNTMYILIVHALFRPQLGQLIPDRFNADGIVYVGIIVPLQLIIGTVLGMMVGQIQKIVRRGIRA